MARFILLTFAFLGWAFYEMSGGSSFEPARPAMADAETDPLKVAEATPDVEVTRVSLNLTSVGDALKANDRRTVLNAQPAKVVAKPAQPAAAAVEPAVFDSDVMESAVIIPSLVVGAQPAPKQATTAPAPVISRASSSTAADIRQVSGNRVNVRGGPGKNHSVVGRLTRGAQVEILEDAGNGWVRLQSLDGRAEGWMADFLLTKG